MNRKYRLFGILLTQHNIAGPDFTNKLKFTNLLKVKPTILSRFQTHDSVTCLTLLVECVFFLDCLYPVLSLLFASHINICAHLNNSSLILLQVRIIHHGNGVFCQLPVVYNLRVCRHPEGVGRRTVCICW